MNSSNWDTILGLNPRHLAVSRRRRSDRAATVARARLTTVGRRSAQAAHVGEDVRLAAMHAGALLAGLRLAAIFVRLLLQEDVPVHRVPRASRHRPLCVAGAAASLSQ
jgi:hypothetical protein